MTEKTKESESRERISKQVEVLAQEIEAVKECGLRGHSWCANISLGGECTIINFSCRRCGSKTTKWLHFRRHRFMRKLLNYALKKGDL
jgi:hypothetical protein